MVQRKQGIFWTQKKHEGVRVSVSLPSSDSKQKGCGIITIAIKTKEIGLRFEKIGYFQNFGNGNLGEWGVFLRSEDSPLLS